ncbi:MAG: hypothetical protein NG747_14620 [Candidatus Brocadia sp.]|nr:hypothetical protein [Candidatus Brocadia sp.]
METSRLLKKGLSGLILSLIVLILGQASFAGDSGIGRIKISNTESGAEGFHAAKAAAMDDASEGPAVLLYAAFTSETESSVDGDDLPTYVPVLGKDAAYVYLAFRVTEPTTVEIKWRLKTEDGQVIFTKNETGFEDPVDGGNLQPGYWYFTWLKVDPSVLQKTTYHFEGRVRPSGSDGWGNAKDSCRFQIVY